ncbi:hypothetical protein JW926_08685, partial [Candidatus Sumerlaeota bacterium]|nr:hypothetical protein [Candidatus Sumerlaeota bacterium]
QTTLEKYLEGDKINSEDHPHLEFESPKYGYGEQPMIDNLNTLLGLKTSILPYLFNISDPEGTKARLKKYEDSLPSIIEGHEHYRSLRMVKACRSYLEAMQTCPEDRATKYLLEFEELKLRVAANPRDVWGYRDLGAVYFEQKRYSEAVTWLNMMLEKASIPPEGSSREFLNYHKDSLIYANKTIGASYLEVGNPKYAVPYLKRALELNPDDPEIQSLFRKAEQ